MKMCDFPATKATSLYPEVARLKRKLRERVEPRGYIETIAGRRHEFAEPNH